MSSNEYGGREPVTRRSHDDAWTADLETEKHGSDRQLVVEEAIEAVEQTSAGQFVDLVTHEAHGHPATYLYAPLRSLDRPHSLADAGRCPCGGYVTRVSLERC